MTRSDYMSIAAALAVGLLFGLGLTVSLMVSPAKILGFLDIAGAWDPSLLLVMVGAVAVTFVGYRWVLSHPAPLLGDRFQVPTRTDLDTRLLAGAGLFGLGWGLAGYCPGPALAALSLGNVKTIAFVASMLAGMLAYNWLDNISKLVSATGPKTQVRR
jgi:uncharacterized protein